MVTPHVEASPDRSDFAKLGETIAASLVQAQEHANHASVFSNRPSSPLTTFDPMGEGVDLPGAGPGNDQQWRRRQSSGGPMLDRTPLLGIEGFEVGRCRLLLDERHAATHAGPDVRVQVRKHANHAAPHGGQRHPDAAIGQPCCFFIPA